MPDAEGSAAAADRGHEWARHECESEGSDADGIPPGRRRVVRFWNHQEEGEHQRDAETRERDPCERLDVLVRDHDPEVQGQSDEQESDQARRLFIPAIE